MDDLRRRMEQLAERGQPRGAARVLAEARRGRFGWARPQVRLVTVVAVAACVLLVAGVATAVWAPVDEPAQQVAGPTTTEPAPTTTVTEPATTTTVGAPATPPRTVPARVVAASRLQPFRSWNAYLGYVKGKGVEVVGPYGLPGIGYSRAAAEASADGAAVAAATVAPESYSTTNNQEAGIDEPDVAKTDGRTIFTIGVDSVLRTSSGRGTPTLLGSLSVPATNTMLLVGDRVVLLGSHHDGQQAYATVAVVDVSTPARPVLASRLQVEGSVVSARLVGGAPRIVLQSTGPELTLSGGNQPEPAQATAQNQRTIQDSALEAWIPNWTMTEGPRRGSTGRLVTFGDIYRPPTFAGFGLLTVMTLNLADPSASDASSVVADGRTVYASANRLYVASYGWGAVSARSAVTPLNETLVHAFDVSAPDRSSYKVSGKVSGSIKDQFSLSEHDGILRVVTTSTTSDTESFVRTLADQGQILEEIGQVGGLGRGEQVYGVRFVGAMGYVVTFRQVDPLYVVDLSDPRRPRVRGELKILGYSAYLHPIGDGLLLGIGAEATEEGRRVGLGASVFDVSDPAAPKRIQHYVLGSAYSPAEFDHHSFLWWAGTGLAVLPVAHRSDDGAAVFIGAIGLRAGRTALAEVGRIQHPGDGNQSTMHGVPQSDIQRSLVIGDRLYTVSQRGIMQSNLATLADVAWVPFS